MRPLPKPFLWSAGVIGLAAAMVACGGGGGSTTPPPPGVASWFDDVSASHLPAGVVDRRCMDVAALDHDGDGDADLLLAIEGGANVVLRNDGTGRFALATVGMLANAGDHEDLAVADLDGDGDLDVAVAAEDTMVHEVYLDQGASFAGMQLGTPSVANSVVALDVDADGDPDLLFGGGGLLVMLNDGAAGFTAEAPGRFPAVSGVIQDLVAHDVDGDGDLDLALGNEGQNQLFLSMGGGAWSDATLTHLPAVIDETRVLSFADADRDGDDDLFVGNVLQELMGGAPQNFLYANDGTGRFAAAPNLVLDGGFGTYGGRFLDFDVDGDPDLMLANADLLDPTQLSGFRLQGNDGTGTYRDLTGNAFGGPVLEHGFGVAAADFNRDGKLDLYLCSRGANAPSGWVGANDHLMFQF